MRKAIFLLAAALAVVFSGDIPAPAQLPAGYAEIRPVSIPPGIGRNGEYRECYLREDGVYTEAKLKPLLENPKCAEEIRALHVDFARHTLVAYRARSDCHMRIRIKIFRGDTDKKYLVIINNIYGGCRAGGSREGWIVLDKMPADYTLEMKEVRVDRIHGVNPDEEKFYFPKQPSGIKPELLESREIDVKGCLALDRQSQWIFIKDEFLQTALEGKSAECKTLFKGLAIDFDKYTLAGYNVNTGHCSRPASLAQKVYKDFDEKRYRMEISFDKPLGSCHALVWHPLWVLAPKLPADHGFEFELKPNKPVE
jgi:hypothetical protein